MELFLLVTYITILDGGGLKFNSYRLYTKDVCDTKLRENYVVTPPPNAIKINQCWHVSEIDGQFDLIQIILKANERKKHGVFYRN